VEESRLGRVMGEVCNPTYLVKESLGKGMSIANIAIT
jgi:hypothetical protein